MWDALAAMEAQVEALGAVAQRERADVEQLERPTVRVWLWATGRLAETETRERAEADAAMAATLRAGDQARQLRTWLEALPAEVPRLRDARVAADLRRLQAADLAHFDVAVDALRPLWERAMRAGRLEDLVRLTVRTAKTFSRERGRRKAHQLQYLRQKLDQAGEHDLTDTVPSEVASTYHVRLGLDALRDALTDRAATVHEGLADALAAVVRAEVEQEVPVLARLREAG